MGIYGALSTAVTGLQAQSYALENISGNIANSQTVGYKRIDTSFADMIPDDGSPNAQTAGSVVASAQQTNDVEGDISSSQVATNMAISGTGFFVVQQPTSQSDGNPVFAGSTAYTRRGDFEVDKSGYLVNGAGYYLEGLPVDSATGNVSGSVPSVIKISNALLPAQPTSEIDYQLNLPADPAVSAAKAGDPSSELLNTADFLPTTITTPATATGTTALTGTSAASSAMPAGSSLTITVNGTPTTFDFYTGTYSGSNTGIDVSSANIGTALGQIQSDLQGLGGSTASATVGLNSSGNVQVTLGSNLTDSMTVTDTTGAGGLGLSTQTVVATGPKPPGPVNTITADQDTAFESESISGGAVTVYGQNGAPANVEFRWAKTDSAATGGTDTWNLYYLSNSAASGSQPMWTNVGVNYTFAANGSMSPPLTSTTINNLTVNGVSLGNLTLQHGTNGVTQFADSNGTTSVTELTQNGYAAGKYTSVAIDSSGRVVASYSNGQQIDVAQVVTANFNGVNSLKQLSGDAFAETTDSGSPILNTDPSISASALEASNTDISSEFSNLIVTQQAYAAGAKIVTTANDMLDQALNMIR